MTIVTMSKSEAGVYTIDVNSETVGVFETEESMHRAYAMVKQTLRAVKKTVMLRDDF